MKILNYMFLLSCILWLCACKDDEVILTSTVSFKEAAMTVSEDTIMVLVPLELTTALNSSAIVYVEIDEESITNGRMGSFASAPIPVHLEAGAVRGNVYLSIIDNGYPNLDCSFDLKITKVEGAVSAAELKQTCKITILDDDDKKRVSVGFDTDTMYVNEDAVILEVPVVVEGLLSDSLTFSVESINGTATEGTVEHFTILTSKVTIFEGENWGAVEIKINDKASIEDDRSFKLILTEVDDHIEGDSLLAILRPGAEECEVTIKKVIRKVMFANALVTVNENTTDIVDFGVKLTAPVNEDVTVKIRPKGEFTAKGHINYEADIEGNIVLEIERGNTLATAEITIIDDTLGNVNRYCDFEIVSAVGASGKNIELVAETSSRILIENDDSSVGFEISNELASKGQKLKIPIHLLGLKENQTIVRIEPILTDGVEEMTHFYIETKDVVILKGDSIGYVEMLIMDPNVETFKFGLRIVEISADGLHNKVYMDQIQKIDIQVGGFILAKQVMKEIVVASYANSYSVSYGGSSNAAELIDGNMGTLWLSAWHDNDATHEKPSDEPYILIYDLDKEYMFGKMELIGRQDCCDDRVIGATIEISSDRVTWKKIFDFNGFPSNKSSGEVFAEKKIKGRYIRLIPKILDPKLNPGLTELYMWAFEE